MAHKKIIDSVMKHGQVTIKDLDEFLRFTLCDYDMRTIDIFWKKIANGTVVDTGTVFPSRLSFLYRAGARFFGKTRYSGNNRNTVACLCEWSRIIVVR